MKKPPIPTYVAAYPNPSKSNSFLIVALLTVTALIAAIFYFKNKNKEDAGI